LVEADDLEIVFELPSEIVPSYGRADCYMEPVEADSSVFMTVLFGYN